MHVHRVGNAQPVRVGLRHCRGRADWKRCLGHAERVIHQGGADFSRAHECVDFAVYSTLDFCQVRMIYVPPFSLSTLLNDALSNYNSICFDRLARGSGIYFHFAEIIFGKRTADLFCSVFHCDRGILSGVHRLFRRPRSGRLESGAVIVFAVFGIVGLRLPVALIIGYSLHGIWDLVHEIHAHGGVSPFGPQK